MDYIVDRIEENFAVLEAPDGAVLRLKAEALPPDVKAGDVLRETDGAFTLDEAAAEARRAALFALQEALLFGDEAEPPADA